jgi:hypothetical protein
LVAAIKAAAKPIPKISFHLFDVGGFSPGDRESFIT